MMTNNSLTIKQLKTILSSLFPYESTALEFNGIINKVGKDKIRCIGLTLGYSMSSIKKAVAKKVDALIIHNVPESRDLKLEYFQNIEKAASKNGLVLFKLHFPLDFSRNGIIDTLCKILRFNATPKNVIYRGHILKGGVYVRVIVNI